MTKKEYIEYWLKSAAEDLATLNYLLKGRRYLHALFFGHLYPEKICKALWVKNNKDNYPPKIHNLLTLVKQAEISLDEKDQLFLLKLNQYQAEGRYPEDLDKLKAITNKQLTLAYIENIKTIAKCLHKKML